MRVVLDSNVIIAAYAARGLCAELFKFCLSKFEIVLSEELLKEVEVNLIKKIKLPGKMTSEIIQDLRSSCNISVPTPVDSKSCRDRNDLHVLGVAISTKANYIVSGDKDLLLIKKYKKISILSPKDFWSKFISK